MSSTNWTGQQTYNAAAVSAAQAEQEQVLAKRALLFDTIMAIPQQNHLRDALIALWYPCFDGEALDLALRQLTSIQATDGRPDPTLFPDERLG